MKTFNTIVLSLLLLVNIVHAKEYHVSKSGNDNNSGSESQPFLTIQAASNIAQPGDTITVHKGVYRERIDPLRGGTSHLNRIVYRVAQGEEAIIKGSEIITGWKKVKGSVWKASVSNSIFDNYHPYKDTVYGDWFISKGITQHTGEVFLNGKSLWEKNTLEAVKASKSYPDARDKASSVYTWYVEVDDENTTFYANFQEYNPNKELTEIAVREACFYPSQPGIDFITVSGFTMTQTATQWSAPTAEQPGLIGTHWSKGWIIENNTISYSKCAGIALGKDRATGHNVWSNNKTKDGAVHYVEVVFNALEAGWAKENIGSHIVRNNTIYNCGQAGIVGSLGAVFSQIYNNHIYDVWVERDFDGKEMAGIKIHAAIDVTIKNNVIHNCNQGLWIDWMAQGTRVSSNILYDNTLVDAHFEVNHGPYIFDNNICLSPKALGDSSEGGAFIHNLFAGNIRSSKPLTRFTPYHLPHSTKVKGLNNCASGDNRFYNNIFIKPSNALPDKRKGNSNIVYGLHGYEPRYKNQVANNVYYNGAFPETSEKDFFKDENFEPTITILQKEDGTYLEMIFNDLPLNKPTRLITTSILGSTITSEAIYDNPDGTPLKINTDFMGKKRGTHPTIGPIENLTEEKLSIKIF